jgi:hypothetical protein
VRRRAIPFAPVLLLAWGTSAVADHGGDPTRSVPLWQFVASGALAVAAVLTVARIRDIVRRRRSDSQADRG